MRKIKLTRVVFIFLVFALTSYNCVAQNLISVQNGSLPSFYTTIDLAITQAQNGDTIYVPGGNFPLSVPINKRIHLLGVGHNPDSTSATNFTFVTGTLTLQSGAKGGEISGLYLLNDIILGGNGFDSVNNYSISRCNFNNLSNPGNPCTNILINENVVRGTIGLGNITNHVLFNNIINGVVSTTNATLSNNIFFSTISCQNCLIQNNILIAIPSMHYYGCSPNCCISGNSVFQNNLFVEDIPTNYGTFANLCPTIIWNNNIFNQSINSIFINQSGNTFNYSHNYHLQLSSAGHNSGTDGADVGIYGGSSPWKEGSVPFNPHVQFKNISGSTTPNGNLPINIKVAAQDH
ncbi:MAG: hypothetical protein JST63_14125 [Bacteroidetes bacterium]|nr:hypothetical protein [Bacteroidota bacterium]